jgi:ABC-type branched-subunit amino acid transport system permease subunit
MERIERLHQMVSGVLQLVLISALAVAYLSALAGVMGIIDAGTVAFIALCGATVAFVAIVAYLAGAELEQRRRLRAG